MGGRIPTMADTEGQKILARQLTVPGAFDPFAFVDLCEQVERSPASDPTVGWLRTVQHAEFEELVNYLAAC